MKWQEIPTLAQYLDGSDRGEAFEKFVLESFDTLGQARTPREQATLRLMKILCIAFVEGLRGEEKACAPLDQTIELFPQVVGYCLMLCMVGDMKEGSPWRRIAKRLESLVKTGAENAIDSIVRKRETI